VNGRAWHGIKRLHITLGFEAAFGDASLVGDVTGNVSAELLRNVYRQQDRKRITAQVDAVRAMIETPEDEPNKRVTRRRTIDANIDSKTREGVRASS
jgi:hypothetical protein